MGFCVYVGRRVEKGPIVYVGTTTQKPARRFSWHKSRGKDLNFSVVAECGSADEMLALERRLIDEHKPELNRRLKQNLNVRLTADQLEARKGSAEWCQCCRRRRVNPGYKHCLYCGE